MADRVQDRLVELRRGFHRHPEPGWREFYTTHRLVEELESIGVDEMAVGPAAYDPADRLAVPDGAAIEPWLDEARARGADESLLEAMAGGNTGVVAVLDRGAGPTIGLRVDIDGLFVDESTEPSHAPSAGGFRSEHPDTMHACGHDAHMTWGLAVLERVKESDFTGRLVVFFQPAEELSGGGKPMAESPYLEGIDYLFAVHVGLDHPTGRVVAGIERPLAMSHLTATFTGTASHAGTAPNEGDNAMQALGSAIVNAYGIPRHADGMTRINIGTVTAGTSSNVIPARATLEGEVRGETTPLREYVKASFRRTLEAAAQMHGCKVSVDVISESPRADSDPALVEYVTGVARDLEPVEAVVPTADFGASEDATYLMQRVQDAGGLASYLIVGTDHPTGHHTPTFDVDERSLEIGVAVLSAVVQRIATLEA